MHTPTVARKAAERPNLDGGRPRSCRVAQIEGLIEAVVATRDDAEAMRLASDAIAKADRVERDAVRLREHARRLLNERVDRLETTCIPEIRQSIADAEARA